MITYKLDQSKDKSPTFASCHAPAKALHPDTPRAAWATCDDPWGQAKENDLHIQPLEGQEGLAWAPAPGGSVLS